MEFSLNNKREYIKLMGKLTETITLLDKALIGNMGGDVLRKNLEDTRAKSISLYVKMNKEKDRLLE